MNIAFTNKKLGKRLRDERTIQNEFGGSLKAKRIIQRLSEIRAALTLEDLRTLPGPRCHTLTGDRNGQISVDLAHPYRLLFLPNHDPIPVSEDGGLDWAQVTNIIIIEITDTHD